VTRTALADRMLAHVDRLYGDPPEHAPELGPCWPWMGALNADGYGVIRGEDPPVKEHDGKRRAPLVLAHRVALSLALGRPLRPGMLALHRCDTPRCCRPRHLREGDHQDNVDDMIAKGRDPYDRRHPKARKIG
jgi:HNH endonuclease